MINLTINGKKIGALEGMTILQAAKRVGINIPTLCHHDSLSPYGVCRLCLVEINQRGRKRLVTSCNFFVEDGLEVETHSERVLSIRKGIMELLLARCPNSKKIKSLAREMGIEKSRFRDEDEDCILCGLCVRVCREIAGANAIAFAERGTARKIATPFFDPSSNCIGCGGCAYVCPTGAITIEDNKIKMGNLIISELKKESAEKVVKIVADRY